jgi:ATP-binding cassette subfamily B protein
MSALRKIALPITPDVVRSLWRLLGRLLGPRRRRLIIHPILGTILAVTDTVALLAIVRLVLMLQDASEDANLLVGPVDVTLSFGNLAFVALAALITSFIARLVEGEFAARHQAMAIAEARRLVVDAWFAADWEQVQDARLGRLQQLVGANALRAAVPVQLLSLGSVAAISLVVYITIILISAPMIALLFAVLGVVSGLVLTPLRRRSKVVAKAHAALLGDLQLASTSYAHLNRELHVFGVQDAAATQLNEMSETTANAYARLKMLQRVVPNVYQQLLLVAIVGIVVVGRAIDVEAVQFGAAAILVVRSLTYIQQLNSSLQIYTEVRPFLDELLDSVAEQRQRLRTRGEKVLGPVRSIRLAGVDYRYPTGTQALTGVDLELSAGDWLGVVGPSGGGKTTFSNLIAGLLRPATGSVTVDGEPADSYSAASWATQFGLLSQEPVLLAASVRDNIAFHREATLEEVRAAARSAGIEREIDALPDGFDSLIGEGRSSLSGGQRQRVALARCLLGSPSCLILDEPTSALDAANEALVERSLLEISSDAIVIVVSHRRALLRRCNRFIVLEQGRVIASGDAEDVDLVGRVSAS